ncbi:hypothetical protein KFE98_18680 [bacterium SCSIO 12741]|nr:hypothetical protein KFE98_18680 [bacterium SCSIO 12741]
MEGVIAVSLPIIISLASFVMIVFLRRYENAEKMKMIEMGFNPKDMVEPPKKKGLMLKFALIAGGVGVGLLVGNFLDQYTGINDDVAYFSMCLIFGGIGLYIADQVMQKRLKEAEEAEKNAQNEESKSTSTPLTHHKD